MTSGLAVPLVEAAAFTAGCAAIHLLRRRADGVTVVLACLATLLALLLVIGSTPEAVLHARSGGVAEEPGFQPME